MDGRKIVSSTSDAIAAHLRVRGTRTRTPVVTSTIPTATAMNVLNGSEGGISAIVSARKVKWHEPKTIHSTESTKMLSRCTRSDCRSIMMAPFIQCVAHLAMQPGHHDMSQLSLAMVPNQSGRYSGGRGFGGWLHPTSR